MEKNERFAVSETDAGDARLKHSGAGIASFILSLASSAMLLAFFFSMGMKAVRIAEQYMDPETGMPAISQEELGEKLLASVDATVFLFPLALLAAMIAIVTGIVALAYKNRKKGLGAAGLIISGMQILFFAFALMLAFSAA